MRRKISEAFREPHFVHGSRNASERKYDCVSILGRNVHSLTYLLYPDGDHGALYDGVFFIKVIEQCPM